MDKKKEILEALAEWVIHTANKKELATPEEIGALPKIAEFLLGNYPSVDSFSPVNKE